MPKYAIGVDFGTLSGRAVLVELGTSRELASSVWNYEYGVMDERLQMCIRDRNRTRWRCSTT